jgi:hypothetical protein
MLESNSTINYLDNDPSHRCCRGRRRESGIDIKATQEAFDELEYYRSIDERVAARADVFDLLIYLDARRYSVEWNGYYVGLVHAAITLEYH